MEPKELLSYQQEAEQIAQENGIYIPVYQLNQFTRLAGKVTNTLVNGLPHGTYEECDLVLEMVRRAFQFGRTVKDNRR